MPVTVVLGAQWGDEGKGKIVDLIAGRMDLVIRFQGGANAGHSVMLGNRKIVLHQIPSGILHLSCYNAIANGCVVDPIALVEEIGTLEAAGLAVTPAGQLMISRSAHVVTPLHRWIDGLHGAQVGTTGRGIGPAYADKVARVGIRLGDVLGPDWSERLQQHEQRIRQAAGGEVPPAMDTWRPGFDQALERIRPFFGDTAALILETEQQGKRILLEGAQGTLLDIDHGSYPFVTSSSTSIGGALTGTGVYLPLDLRIGVFKAYCTRVGNGPFPTELTDETGETLRRIGQEFGATTGRPRRCGWLDLPLLKQACRINGFNGLILTKLDCLSTFPVIKVAVGAPDPDRREYKEFPGWNCPLDGYGAREKLPPAARGFLDFIEEQLDVPLAAISIGPGRHQILQEAWA